jgi:ketosteroid isomerase-like protein
MFEQRVQRAMSALERRDLAAIMDSWADDGVFELAGHTPISGRYEGREAVEGMFRRLFAGTTELRATVRHVALANPLGLTRNNSIYVEYGVDETGTNGATVHDERIAVYTYRQGKLVMVREWAFDPTLIEQVWGRVDPWPTARIDDAASVSPAG